MRKVTVSVEVKISMIVAEDTLVQDIINEMDYSFMDTTGAIIGDCEITDYLVLSSEQEN